MLPEADALPAADGARRCALRGAAVAGSGDGDGPGRLNRRRSGRCSALRPKQTCEVALSKQSRRPAAEFYNDDAVFICQ